MQELVTLCMSDIGRLLGTLGLLSLGITLTLWGLKRRWRGAVVMALFLCLAALVPTVLAIELPPVDSYVYIQTSGPDAGLTIGDWYTNSGTAGPGYHSFNIYVPCTIAPTQLITVELFDPEVWHDGSADELDEIRNGPVNRTNDNDDADDSTFTLLDPSGAQVMRREYSAPSPTTSGVYTTFVSFSPGPNCGIYTLIATTSGDDDNAWRLKVTPDDPDGEPLSGDEISLGNLQTSFQNTAYDCQTFHFFVPDILSIRLSNFDMDNSGTIEYISPSDVITPATLSPDSRWNNGGESSPYPPPGGDLIADPEPGWWRATVCVDVENQYIFDTGGQVYFYEKPPAPDMTVSKDDGTATFVPGGVLNYTITYANGGTGPALYVVLTDTLPLSTTFVSCTPPSGASCGYSLPPPGSGIVTFSLGTVRAGQSGSVRVSVQVDADAPTGTITNTVELDYTDIVFSDYPPERDTDVDQYEANGAIEIAKTVYLGHDGGAGCPGGESVTGANGADVTYCFEVTNIGITYLDDITINDPDLGITEADMTLLSGSTPLTPTFSLVYYYEMVIDGDLDNTASTSGNPTDEDGNDLPELDDPTAGDTAAVDEANGAIEIAKTVYLGHDGGAGCPGGESVTGANGADVTYCFEVTNIGITYLDDITINDPDLGITEADMTLLSGSTPLTPTFSLVYYYEMVIDGDLDNTASTSGNPTDEDGNDLPELDDPTADDTAAVLIPTPTPTRRKKEEPTKGPPPPPTPTATVPPTLVPTPTVEVLAVERLPETGGFPGWLTVVLGVPVLIGAAGLLNLALLEIRGRRGNGKRD